MPFPLYSEYQAVQVKLIQGPINGEEKNQSIMGVLCKSSWATVGLGKGLIKHFRRKTWDYLDTEKLCFSLCLHSRFYISEF